MSLVSVAMLGLVALMNTATFYVLLLRGHIHTGVPLPLSLLLAAALWLVGREIRRSFPAAANLHTTFATIPALAACLVIFPLAQEFLFGKTDYSRKADAVVVFGADHQPPLVGVRKKRRPAISFVHRTDLMR